MFQYLKDNIKPGLNPGDGKAMAIHAGLAILALALGLGVQYGAALPQPWGAVIVAVCAGVLPSLKQYLGDTTPTPAPTPSPNSPASIPAGPGHWPMGDK